MVENSWVWNLIRLREARFHFLCSFKYEQGWLKFYDYVFKIVIISSLTLTLIANIGFSNCWSSQGNVFLTQREWGSFWPFKFSEKKPLYNKNVGKRKQVHKRLSVVLRFEFSRGTYPLVPDEGPEMNNSIASSLILGVYLLNFIIQS